jgi:hypothetical protein
VPAGPGIRSGGAASESITYTVHSGDVKRKSSSKLKRA